MRDFVEVVDRMGFGHDQAPVAGLVEAVMAAERASGTVVIAFVDESEIAGLNACYRGLDEPTDVLSFSYIDADGEWPVQLSAPPGVDVDISDDDRLPDLGEVVVCPAVVLRYALEDGDDPARRLAWAVLHGVLHLVGYDHEHDNGEMREREQALLGELDRLVRAFSYPENHRSH